jgi:hypothetical protein
MMRIARALSVAAMVSSVWACASRDESHDMTRNRLTALLATSRVQRARAGLRPSRAANGEFGIITGARMSPDGRWLVVVDETPPNVKIVNDSGQSIATIALKPGTGDELTAWPVVAISNKSILVIRPDLRIAELYDLKGQLKSSLGAIDFFPVTATAVSDSVWLAYGPSEQRTKGMSNVVHCLYAGDRSAPRWTAGFPNRADSLRTGSANVSVPLASGASVTLEHRQLGSRVLLSVECGDGSRDPVTSIVRGDSAETTGTFGRSPAKAYGEASGDAGAGLTRVAGRLWTISADNAPSITFRAVGGPPENGAVRVPGDYRFMDSRAGIGVLFASDSAVPMLFLVRDDALSRTLGVRAVASGQP